MKLLFVHILSSYPLEFLHSIQEALEGDLTGKLAQELQAAAEEEKQKLKKDVPHFFGEGFALDISYFLLTVCTNVCF